MSETKRIRYKSVDNGVSGPFGAVVHNVDGTWEPGDVKDVPAARADSYVANGGFEFTDAETKEETAKRLEAAVAKGVKAADEGVKAAGEIVAAFSNINTASAKVEQKIAAAHEDDPES